MMAHRPDVPARSGKLPPSGRAGGEAVAVIGLGAMGSRFAGRLLDCGLRVVVWNRSPGKAAALVARGAKEVRSPADAARQAGTIITSLPDADSVFALTQGRDGIGAGIGPGGLLIEMSTIGPDAISTLRNMLPEDSALVDAPVLGSIAEAETGTCLVFAGGPDGAVRDADRVLSHLGKVQHCGELGSGAAAKLVANAALLSAVCALGEVLSLADRLGLPRDLTFKVLAATPLGEQARKRRPAIEQRCFPARYSLYLAAKDSELITKASTLARGQSLRLLAGTKAWFHEALYAGWGHHDYTVVLERIATRGRVDGSGPQSEGLDQVGGATRYQGLVLDLDGTVWRGGQVIAGVAEALQRLRDAGMGVAFVTNDPSRTREQIADALTRQGIPTLVQQVFTAAAAAPAVIRHHQPGVQHVLVLGPPALVHEAIAAGMRAETSAAGKAVEAVLVGAYPGFGYEELCTAIRAIRAGAQLFATGRETVYAASDGLSPATGTIVAALEAATDVMATIVGKPEPGLFKLASSTLKDFQPLAVVGDHLLADIAGAKSAGLDAILTLNGVTSPGDLDHADVRPDLVVEDLPALLTQLDVATTTISANISTTPRDSGASTE